MEHNIWLYILVMAGVSYLIRMTPLVLIRREIKSPVIRSFLYYVPYVTLAVMTGGGHRAGLPGVQPLPGGGVQLRGGAGGGVLPAVRHPAKIIRAPGVLPGAFLTALGRPVSRPPGSSCGWGL